MLANATSVITRSPGSRLAASRYSTRSPDYPSSPVLPYNTSSAIHFSYSPLSNLVAKNATSTGFHSSGSGLVGSRSSTRSRGCSSLPASPSRNASSTVRSSYSSSVRLNGTYIKSTSTSQEVEWGEEFLDSLVPDFGYHVSTKCTPSYPSNAVASPYFDPGAQCLLAASAVQVLYWHTSYATPVNNLSITHEPVMRTAVGRDGYIYTSPSVYLVFPGLSDEILKVGPTFNYLTLAYGPSAISTMPFNPGCASYQVGKVFDFQDLNLPPRWSILSAHQGCDLCGQTYSFPGSAHPGDELATEYANMTFHYNDQASEGGKWTGLRPYIAMPPDLTKLYSGWSSCNVLYYVLDPARPLIPTDGLGPKSPPTISPASDAGTIPENPSPAPDLPMPPQETGTSQHGPKGGGIGIGGSTVAPGSTAQIGNAQVSVGQNDLKVLPNTLPYVSVNPPNHQAANKPPTGLDSGNIPPNNLANVTPALGIMAAGQTFTPVNEGTVVANGVTISSGGPPKTINGVPVSVGDSGLIVGDSTFAVPTTTNSQQVADANKPLPVITAAGQTFSQVAPGVLAADNGITLKQGAPALDLGGTSVSFGSKGLGAGSSTIAIPTVASQPPLVFAGAGQTFSTIAPNVVVSMGVCLIKGAPATKINGTRVTFGSEGIVAGGSTIAVPIPGSKSEVFTAASQIFTSLDGSHLLVKGITLDKGGSAKTVDESVMSFGLQGLVVGSSTIAIATSATVHNVDGQMFRPLPNGEVVVSGETLNEGAPVTKIAGHLMSLGPQGLVVDSSTIPIPTGSPMFTADGQIFTPLPNGHLGISRATLSKGGPPTTIGGHEISLGSDGLIIDSSTVPIPNAVLTADGQTFTPLANGGLVIGNVTLSEDGPTDTINGHFLSYGTQGLTIDDSTNAILTFTSAPSFTAAGQTFTSINNSQLVVQGSTLDKNGPAETIEGHVLSYGSQGLVVDGATIAVPTITSASSSFAAITAAGQTFIPIDNSEVVDEGTTLSVGGPAMTVDGSLVSMASAGLVFGSSTIPLTTMSVTDSSGGAVATLGPGQGQGPAPGPSATKSQGHKGGASRLEIFRLP